MSSIGNSIAAGVAQVGLQAQQVARQRDRQETQSSDEARRLREAFETHLNQLEEADGDTFSQIHVDTNLPEHQNGSGREKRRKHASVPPTAMEEPKSPELAATEADPAATDPANPLYRHVDIQA